MKKKFNQYLICCSLILITYIALSLILSDYWESSYTSKLNEQRNHNRLPELTENYLLDTSYQANEQFNIQCWSLKSNQISSEPFHTRKNIWYSKSFWLWKNEYLGESDYYEIKISPEVKIDLNTFYDKKKNQFTYQLDTNLTVLGKEQKIQKENEMFKRAEEEGYYLCGTALLDDFSFYEEISREKFISILTEWSLKLE